MSRAQEGALALGRGSKTVSGTTTTKGSRPKRSQQDRVKSLLERQWCCGLLFLDPPDGGPPILRYTARIGEIRKSGIYVDRRPCQHPWHDHDAQMWEWRIAEGATLPGLGDV